MRNDRPRGFALIIALVLLGLLLLSVLALGVQVRVYGQMATTAGHQVQARQNAQLALSLALGDLQEAAGVDSRITGMAGIAGVPAGAASSTRYWCGVWREDGTFVQWLASGATGATNAGSDTIELIGAGSVGAAASTSANVEKEHAIAGRLPIIVSETPGQPGTAVRIGSYAWMVIDEGAKLPAYALVDQLNSVGAPPGISPTMLANQRKLRDALSAYASRLPRVVAYEQLANLPGAAGALTPSVLQDCFHYVALTPRWVSGSGYRTGLVNLNTASTLIWRCLLDTYNTQSGAKPLSASEVTSKGNQIGNGYAATTAGKSAGGPFLSVAAFGNYLATVFPAKGSPNVEDILAALAPMLAVRSDTFRIRAYGDALNPADDTAIEATAWCEAIVQRTPELAPNNLGRRFVITYFRWLGANDI